MVTTTTEPLRPPKEGMTDKELFRWYFEVWRKVQELEAEIKRLTPVP